MKLPHSPIVFFFIAGLSLALFSWLVGHPYFADPDSFYHIGVSRLMYDHGKLAVDFDALPLTTLADTYADQAWGYHLLLIPFLTAFDDAAGYKVLAVLLATAVIVSVYGIARCWRAPFPWAYPLALLLTTPFVFRLALGKPSSAAVLLFIWGVYALLKKRPWLLLGLSTVFVWTHGSWPLIVGMCALAALLQRDWRSILPPFAGVIVGLVLNPYFPANLIFFWQQTVLIGLMGFRDTIGVGREWYPYPLDDFLGDTAPILAFALLAVYGMLMRRDRSPRAHTLLWSSVALFIITLRANRAIEFLAPLLVLFSASLAAAHKDFLAGFFARIPYRRAIAATLAMLSCMAALQLIQLKPLLARGYRYDAFADASAWLKEHVAPGTLVINTRWEDFPALWMRNPQLQYAIGLDPAFLYLENPDAYHAWQRLTRGESTPDPAVIRNTFASDVIIVKKEFPALYDALRTSPQWKLAYEGEEVWVYEAPDSTPP